MYLLTHSRTIWFVLATVSTLCYSACFVPRWAEGGSKVTAYQVSPEAKSKMVKAFSVHPKNTYATPVLSPGIKYKYDIAEKDALYDHASGQLVFTRVTFSLAPNSPANQMLADVRFWDKFDNYLELTRVDLMRITPLVDSRDSMQYGEYILEEYNRFGVQFRKEFQEFRIVTKTANSELAAAVERAYRVDLTNNCLDPRKWEVQLVSRDFSDKRRFASKQNYNQDRMLSHSWFAFDAGIYQAMLEAKNPHVSPALFALTYQELSARGEKTQVNFNALRKPLKRKVNTKIEELGFQTNKVITPVDVETGYKRTFGLLGADTFHTYKTILEKPIAMAAFLEEGFYTPERPNVYELGFLQYCDEVTIHQIDLPTSDATVEIKITGQYAPYTFSIGNLDLALLDEQRWYGINTGINLYPRSRRYNPVDNTLFADPDMLPADQQPYFLLTDTKSGNWVNNQYKGVERALIGFDALDSNTLEIYLLSYERETPVWYGRVRIDGAMRENIRARRNLLNY